MAWSSTDGRLKDFDQCGAEYQSLSNQDYYSQLEALKRMHLQNIAHLDVMYLNELSASKGKASQEAQMSDKDEIDSAQEADESLPAKRWTNTIPRQDIKLQQNSVSKSDISGSRAMKVEKAKKEEKEEKEKEEEEKEDKEEAAGQASRQSSGVRDEAKSSKPRAQPERWAVSKPASAAAKHQPRAPSRRPSGAEPSSRIAKVTVPKPFKMMLREDDKKRRNQKTRSEVELENTLLRKELTELRECRRQFRATPAPPPPRTRPPLSEVFSQRATGGRSRTTSLDRAARADPGSNRRAGGSRDISPEPFSFIERERRKREVRLEAVLSSPTSREERWVFKARPLPRLYRAASDDYHLFGATETHSRGEEQHRGPDVSRERLKHTGRLEDERAGVEVEEEEETEEKSEDGEHGADESTDGAETPILCSNWRLRRKPSLASKGLLVEGETGGVRGGREGETGGVRRGREGGKERDWSYIHPIRRTSISLNLASSFSVSQEQLPTGKSDYISV